MSTRRRITGELTVALPPEQAFVYFTPRGEEAWAPGWKPRFPADSPDDTEPGTVFETGEHTTWVVLERTAGRSISYARVAPGSHAGTVHVELEPAAGGSRVRVTYDVTAVSAEGERALIHLEGFETAWEEAIGDAFTAGTPYDRGRP